MIYANGDEYEGDWKDDKRNGMGNFKANNNDKYSGEWKNDKKDGKGKMSIYT